MKLKTSNKTVMFYGNVLRVNIHAKWIAVDENGVMRAFEDEPYIPHNQEVWESGSAGIWRLESYMELEGDNWKETLAYCPQDQSWMIAVVGKLHSAYLLQDDNEYHKAMHLIINDIADIIRSKSVNCSVRDTFNAFMKHAAPPCLQATPVVDVLRDNLFSNAKEPESRIVKDYYGMDVIVPGWARWVAMNCNGSVMAFEVQPGITPWDIWGNAIHGKSGAPTQVAWRDESTSIANWRDSLQEVQV